MAGHSRAVEKDEAPYGLNATRARPVSMVQVRHGCLGCCHGGAQVYTTVSTLIRGGNSERGLSHVWEGYTTVKLSYMWEGYTTARSRVLTTRHARLEVEGRKEYI